MNSVKPLKDTVAKLNARGSTSGTANGRKLDASWMSGDTSKVARANIITRFQSQHTRNSNADNCRQVLVVNDLAAHGLDFPLCDLVINLELPSDAMHYAHRAGRTGRFGQLHGQGIVLSLVVRGVDDFVVRDKFMKQLNVTMSQAEIRNGEVVIENYGTAHTNNNDGNNTVEKKEDGEADTSGNKAQMKTVVGKGNLILLKAPKP